MKNTYPFIPVALFCLSLSLVPACSKKSGSPAQTCQIITVTDQLGTATTTYNITYNNSGQISTEQYASGGVNYTRVFTYLGSTEMISTSDGTSTVTDSITLNSDGLIVSDYNTYSSNVTVTTYTYSGTELQKEVQVQNGGTPSTTTFTWTNGDVTGSSSGSGSSTYSYNTKASAVGDYWSIVQLINYGASFVKTAHQLTGYQVGTTVENVNYTYDNTGKITGLTGTSGSTVETIGYQYTCN
ncbi:MAG TPA: hypothetical protein VL978_10910 [Puia sp.]|nr:hypothetical protein [Puia sp.]